MNKFSTKCIFSIILNLQSLTFIHKNIFFYFQYTTLQMFVEPFAKEFNVNQKECLN